jgi:hypothetical protein
MKRAAELRGLSEDYHHGLVNARRLREAASAEADGQVRTARAVLEFWQSEPRRSDRVIAYTIVLRRRLSQ